MEIEKEIVGQSPEDGQEVTSDETNVETEAAGEEKPVSMEDTLRAKYRELTTPVEEKPVEVADEKLRGADGKFIAKEESEQKPVVVELKPGEVKSEIKPTEQKAVDDPNLGKVPSSWSAKGQAAWTKMDADSRAEVLKRENDFHNGLEKYRKDSEVFKLLDAEIRPYEPMIRAMGTNAIQVIRDSMNSLYRLRTGTPEEKIQVLLKVAEDSGADLTLIPTVQDKLSQGQSIVPPEYRQLQTQLQQVQETLAQRDAREKTEFQARQQAELAEVQRELATWSVNKPHYEAVKQTMAALLESGQAKDYDDAYDKATWSHPEVRATLQTQQVEAQRKLAAEKAAAAKQASSTNVKPRGVPPAKQAKKVGTMEDTLREAYKKLTAA